MKRTEQIFLTILSTIMIFSCNNSNSTKVSDINQNQKSPNHTDNSKEQNKNNKKFCPYQQQYRYMIMNIDNEKLVYGERQEVNSIYCIEIGYGMGTVDYVYYKYDVDNIPLIASCLKVNWGMGDQLEYELLDKMEKNTENFNISNYPKKMNETSFQQKIEIIFDKAQKKAINLAKS